VVMAELELESPDDVVLLDSSDEVLLESSDEVVAEVVLEPADDVVVDVTAACWLAGDDVVVPIEPS
jgi:hypothetical protein